MENIKYRVCYGNFELKQSELPRNIDDYQLKFHASDKAVKDDYSVFAEFDAKNQAFTELNKHKSDIRETQLRVGSGYCGTVWWLESADDNSVERLADAEWE